MLLYVVVGEFVLLCFAYVCVGCVILLVVGRLPCFVNFDCLVLLPFSLLSLFSVLSVCCLYLFCRWLCSVWFCWSVCFCFRMLVFAGCALRVLACVFLCLCVIVCVL